VRGSLDCVFILPVGLSVLSLPFIPAMQCQTGGVLSALQENTWWDWPMSNHFFSKAQTYSIHSVSIKSVQRKQKLPLPTLSEVQEGGGEGGL